MTMTSSPTMPPTADSVLRRANATSSRRSVRSSERLAVSAITDTRIEQCVAHIDQYVDEDEDHRVEQDEVLDDDDVALDQRGYERASQTGHTEGLFYCHRAAQHETKQHAGDGDNGQERVGQGVAQHDAPLLGAPGTRGAHIILVDDLEKARRRHPGDVSALGQTEDNGRADHDLEVLPGRLPEVDDDDGRLVPEPEQQGQHDEHAEP